jgi:predicted O-methyltransferase YrrM
MINNEFLQAIYRTRTVEDADGNSYPLADHIDEAECNFLGEFIAAHPDVVQTLEVGCAFGLSSLQITGSIAGRPGAHHIILDPCQSSDFHGIGIANLRRAGVNWFELREEPSEIALPQLVGERPESFDLIFIDGWHTFDHTLVDLFFANRLVRVGGYIIVDDCSMSAVAKAVDYVSKYPAYRIADSSPLPRRRRLASHVVRSIPPGLAASVLPRNLYDRHYVRRLFPSMIALQKTAPDERSWNWFVPF